MTDKNRKPVRMKSIAVFALVFSATTAIIISPVSSSVHNAESLAVKFAIMMAGIATCLTIGIVAMLITEKRIDNQTNKK